MKNVLLGMTIVALLIVSITSARSHVIHSERIDKLTKTCNDLMKLHVRQEIKINDVIIDMHDLKKKHDFIGAASRMGWGQASRFVRSDEWLEVWDGEDGQ